jgi:archaellum component FlaC
MNTLTKEHFDKRIDKVDTYITGLRNDLDGMTTMVAKGFEDVISRLDVRDCVEALEKQMKKVGTALNVHL